MGTSVTVSCSDPRVIPEQYFNLNRNEAAIIRNAGGRVVDAMRSINALDAIGNMGTLIIVHHTGMFITVWNRHMEQGYGNEA
jgi:carbonic anhydrase